MRHLGIEGGGHNTFCASKKRRSSMIFHHVNIIPEGFCTIFVHCGFASASEMKTLPLISTCYLLQIIIQG